MKKLSLKQIEQKYKESHPDVESKIYFSLDDEPDSPTFFIEHPLFQKDSTKKQLKRAIDSDDQIGMAQAVLGKQWQDFVKAGGQSYQVMFLFNSLQDDLKAETPEGVPTQR